MLTVHTDSLLSETVRMIAMTETATPLSDATPRSDCGQPRHVDVRLAVPLCLDDVQTLHAWLQEPKQVDVSHLVIDRSGVTVASHRDWEAHRVVTAPRTHDLSRDLNTAVAMLRAALAHHS